jgi:hypothetical protein
MTRQQMEEIDNKLNPCTLPGNWKKPGMCTTQNHKYVICYDQDETYPVNGCITTAYCSTAEEATTLWNKMFPTENK